MLKVLVWIYRWLAKSARTLDIFRCDKAVVDEETSAKDIYIGQTLLTAVAIICIATIFYLIMKGADLAAVGLILLLFFGFYFLWQKGEKITVTIDKTLKAEPERKPIATWVLPGYCNRYFEVSCEEELGSGKYDEYVDLNLDYTGTVTGSVLLSSGITIETKEIDIEVMPQKAKDLGTITTATTIPDSVSEACLKLVDEAAEGLKGN